MTIATQAAQSTNRISSLAHRFALGEAVRLKDGFRTLGAVFVVTAKLPPKDGSPQYRIRNEAERFERMAMQSSLEPVIEDDETANVV